ncbi:unnamed protein product [Rotaria sp. Silwood1]|nr:unnamed protein product [Rotaria sp. Silwood1]CAF4984598.1 unnamed protein product [Rotaria sp. Silwood1]
MATITSKLYCVKCKKQKATSKCAGCLQDFCYNHLIEHHEQLSGELDKVEMDHDFVRQTLVEQLNDSKNDSLIEQINKWEEDSIIKIQQIAEECKQLLFQHTNKYINPIKINLDKLTDQLRQAREENDFNEIDLKEFKEKLTQLSQKLDKPLNISITQNSASIINKISVVIPSEQLFPPMNININTQWIQNGITIAGGYGQGKQLNQLSYPCGLYVDDDDQSIYIADYLNHRIIQWNYDDNQSQVIAGGNGQGNRIDQLNSPKDVIVDKKNDSLIICDSGNRRVVQWSRRNSTNQQVIISDIDCSRLAMDNNGDLYVSDLEKNEVRRWKIGDKTGIIVAGGNGKGNHLNQFNGSSSIFIDQDYSVYVSDLYNNRVMKWMKGAKEGIIVAGGQGRGNSLQQLSSPNGLIVDQSGNVYVADGDNNRIMRWVKGSKQGCIVVGGNGEGKQANKFNYIKDLSFDQQGNLYVIDSDNARVQKFHVHSD